MSLIVVAAMTVTGAIGFWAGWTCRSDKAEALEEKARATLAIARGRHAQSYPVRRPGTGELVALYTTVAPE